VSETIFALSSGAPPAAIAVVRISGPAADEALRALAGTLPEPRRFHLAELRAGGELLDRALTVRFPGPNSATGEDLVELHLHGGRAVVEAVQAALGAIAGLRRAEPGEFTRRAFENGRIDLAEAEGLADLLEAETEAQRRSALSLAGGALSRQVEQWQARLLAVAAEVEARLDFDDEGDVRDSGRNEFGAELAALVEEIESWLARPSAERLKDGVRIVIAGPPNVGKSSLLNALAGRDAAITSVVPGTTRDVIEAPVAIGGSPFLLIDTAGIRDSTDEIESIGIERARRSLESADILLWLGEPRDAPPRAVTVRSKRDLHGLDPQADFSVSATSGEGLDELARMLIRNSAKVLPHGGEVALNHRHRAALTDVIAALGDVHAKSDPLIIAEAIRLARVELDRVTGSAGVEDMLDALFGRFCIGK
jgi:tRNA modification GTPase